MLWPFVVGLVVLVLGPALVSSIAAFFRYNLLSPPEFVGFDNFSRLFSDEVFRISLRNSLWFVGWAVPLRGLVAVSVALVLFRRSRGGGVLRTTAFVPSVMPEIAYALVWIWILNPIYGPLNLLLSAFGIDGPVWLTTPSSARMAVVLMALFQVGEGVAIALIARAMVPRELEEVALTEGASKWRVFTTVTFPLMVPALLIMVIRDTIFALQGTFVPALIVTKGGPPQFSTTYLPLFIYRNAFTYLRYGYASAATLVVLIITAAIVWLEWEIISSWRRRVRAGAGVSDSPAGAS